MKVVLFCGGLGLRMREAGERIPKPMMLVGNRPVLWHIMKYYAHFGHREFILCLGHKAEVIKEFFLTYNEALSNNFMLAGTDRTIELLGPSDIGDWRITFVDTGLRATVGQRLKAVESFLADEEIFLANYGDVLTDAPLPEIVALVEKENTLASFLCVRPNHTFHVVGLENGNVTSVQDVTKADIWINGGYFAFRREIFAHLGAGEDLVEEPFHRLIEQRQLSAYRYTGFWAPMDTLKDKARLDSLVESGTAPWKIWDASDRPR